MPPLKALPGSPATFTVTAQDPDTLEALQGVPTFLDQRLPPAGPPVQVAGGQTNASGQVQFSLALPSAPGKYLYRARTPGLAERFRSDTSRELEIEVIESAV